MARALAVGLLGVVVAVLGTGLGACEPSTTTTPPGSPIAALPSGPDLPGLTWHKAPAVARPDEAFASTTTGSIPPDAADRAGHPGHYVGQAIVSDVAAVPGGPLVAVGYVGVDGTWTALAWTSVDGETWRLAPIDTAPGSFAARVTAIPAGSSAAAAGARFVAVGRSGATAVAWLSPDGSTWRRQDLPAAGGAPDPPPADAERATAVLVADDGIIAGGSRGPELGTRQARIWRSSDGATWTAASDDAGFDGGEVTAIARGPTGLVAVGHLGTGETPTGSAAWTSSDGSIWSVAADPGFAETLVEGLALTPDGTLVTVGAGLDQQTAVALRSTDGRSWTAAPAQEALAYHGLKIGMTDVVAVPNGLVAVGEYSSLQRPTAMSWTSPDGLTWTRSAAAPDLEQGEMLALTRAADHLVAVGSYGLPDDFIPTIWLGTTPGG